VLAVWKLRNLDTLSDRIFADTCKRISDDAQWRRGFIPHPTTYINGDRWEDALQAESVEPPWQQVASIPDHKLADFCRRHNLPAEAPRGAGYPEWRAHIAERLRA